MPVQILQNLCENLGATVASLALIDWEDNRVYSRETVFHGEVPAEFSLPGVKLQRAIRTQRKNELARPALSIESDVMESGEVQTGPSSEVFENSQNNITGVNRVVVFPIRFLEKKLGTVLLGFADLDHSPEPLEEKVSSYLEEHTFSLARLLLFVSGRSASPHPFITGNTKEWNRVEDMIVKSTLYEFPVYIYGERGTGKELVADFIHHMGDRSGEPFVKVNCASIPKNISESELFGHRAGAFTGARENKKGKFLLADGGTLLLDEVGELSMENQKKLLRVLQTGEVSPVGADRSEQVDVRILCSTNSYLEDAVRTGEIRSDLFDRLNVLKIELPPLRRWKGMIPELANVYLDEVSGQNGYHGSAENMKFENGAMDSLKEYPFPGNCRELYNVLRKLFVQTENIPITDSDVNRILKSLEVTGENGAPTVPDTFSRIFSNSKNPSVMKDRAEYLFLKKALEECRGDVDKISDDWDCSRQNIYRLCKKHDLTPSEYRP